MVKSIHLMAVTIVTPDAATGAVSRSQANPFYGLALILLNIYIFLLFSRIPESLPSLHLGIVMVCLLLCSVVLLNPLGAFTNRIGLFQVAFCGWLVFSIPFSVWPGGSASAYTDWLKTFSVFVVTASLLTSVRSCRTVIYSAAAGISWVAVMGSLLGGLGGSRLAMGVGRYGDANDFAQIMLVGLAFWCLIAFAPQRSLLGKIGPLACIALQLFAFARTGSRGGLIGLFLTAAILFAYSSFMARVKLIMILSCAAVLSAAFLPHVILLRYRSIVADQENNYTSEEEARHMEGAGGSREGRTYLLKTSLLLTLKHPVTGVGLGMFAVAEDDKARAAGRVNGMWHETHNMYTQVSSECGIPALIFFLMTIIRSMRDLGAIRKGRHPATEVEPTLEQRHMAFWVSIASWGMITSGIFLSVAFTPELQFLLALMTGVSRAVHRENVLPQTADARPAPVPVRQRVPAVASYSTGF
jgi:O-antigen ligase